MRDTRIYFVIAFLSMHISLIPLLSSAQTKPAKIWASVRFNKSEVMVGEPLMVTVTIYTSTWFTSPPQYDEIQVPNAIMVRFQQRTGSTTKTIGRKQYPAIEQKFVVYPTQVGETVLPEIKIIAECPPEGDYKGRKRIIHSPERSFKVMAPPEGVVLDKWLTANNVTVTETWSPALENLKAGDIVERRITIRTSGALAAMIPPLTVPEISFGSIYQKPALLNNVQTASSFSGSREEVWTYLFQSAGNFEIPSIEYNWFKPRTKSMNKEQIPGQTITIAENPDLDFVLSMQDSLQAILAVNELEDETKAAFSWMGMNWWQLLLVIVSMVLVSRWIIWMAKSWYIHKQQKKQTALESETHYFSLLKDTAKKGDVNQVLPQLMFWYDRFRDDGLNPEFHDFLNWAADEQLQDSFEHLVKYPYSNEIEGPESSYNKFVGRLEQARKRYLAQGGSAVDHSELPKLNP